MCPSFNSVNLTKDATTNTRNFSIDVTKENNENFSIYMFSDYSGSSYLTVSVDWTQTGMKTAVSEPYLIKFSSAV